MRSESERGAGLFAAGGAAKVKSPAMLEHMSVAAVASNRTPTVAVLGILIDCDMDSPLQLTGDMEPTAIGSNSRAGDPEIPTTPSTRHSMVVFGIAIMVSGRGNR